MSYLLILLNIIGFYFLVLTFIKAIKNYPILPDKIPIHFDLEGKADQYGGKKWIFFLPILGLIFFMIMVIISYADLEYNYPVDITEENYKIQKSIADITIGVVNLLCVMALYFSTLLMINYSNIEKRKRLSNGVLLIVALSILVPIVMIVIAYINK